MFCEGLIDLEIKHEPELLYIRPVLGSHIPDVVKAGEQRENVVKTYPESE